MEVSAGSDSGSGVVVVVEGEEGVVSAVLSEELPGANSTGGLSEALGSFFENAFEGLDNFWGCSLG